MNGWKAIGLPLTVVAAIGAGVGVFTACSSSNNNPPPPPPSGGGQCSANPGEYPAPDCLISDQSTCGTPTTCAIDETKCGSSKTCEPLANNTGKSLLDFRIRRLNVIAPPSLAIDIVQNSVVTHGVDLNAKECGELGDGSFSWLIQVDTATNKLTTGGAPPSSDPFGTGYCFVKTTSPDGIALAPSTVSIHKNADGTWDSDTIDTLNIPIYYQPGPNQQIIVLPINGGAVKGLKISDDQNCIGHLDTTAIQANCADNPNTCAKWLTDGSLAGYITLEEADKVRVPLLQNKSLCVLLTGATADPKTNGCPRDASGKITNKGDYCSTTKSAGGCQDSYWLAATFAASAAKITDGTGVADCSGGGSTQGDAGSDSGGSSDAAGD